jgi:mono/diheme cytochrome c family protein
MIASSTAGCTKGTSSSGPASSGPSASASVTGPITDSGSTGLKAAPGAVAAADAGHGKAIYAQNCAACHGATGAEGGVGPSLRHERARKTAAQVDAWIKNPVPPMPKLYPAPLSEADVADVTAFIDSL